MYKVSVIIPVYKTEKYLRQCVDSILNQTYKNIEMILVDDGSPDKSGEICDEYGRCHPNIRVIHKENSGAADARNAGICMAQGEYILFMDSDDYWNLEDGLEKLVHQADIGHYDMINFHYVKLFEDSGKMQDAFLHIEEKEFVGRGRCECFYLMMEKGQYIASPCNKMIKRGLFEENDLLFRKGVFTEDVEWCARLAICAENYGVSGLELYVYRQHDSSTSHCLTLKHLSDLGGNIVASAMYAEKIIDDFKVPYLSYVAHQYAVFFVSAGYVGKQDMKELYREMKKYVYLLDYDASPKVKQMKKIYRLSGYKGLCLAGRIYAKIRK